MKKVKVNVFQKLTRIDTETKSALDRAVFKLDTTEAEVLREALKVWLLKMGFYSIKKGKRNNAKRNKKS